MRCGEFPGAPVTLAALELRFADRPAAAAYIAAVRHARFAPHGPAPTAAGRRALRAALARRRGLPGRLRALLALPPDLHRHA